MREQREPSHEQRRGCWMIDRWAFVVWQSRWWLIKHFGSITWFYISEMHETHVILRTELCTRSVSCSFWRYLAAWIKDLYNLSSVSSLAQGPRGVKWNAVEAASISRQSVWRQWDRAAGKILKGRCGCSNVLTNSRKFPLNPVCWVFCACSQLRRRRKKRGKKRQRKRKRSHLLFRADRKETSVGECSQK